MQSFSMFLDFFLNIYNFIAKSSRFPKIFAEKLSCCRIIKISWLFKTLDRNCQFCPIFWNVQIFLTSYPEYPLSWFARYFDFPLKIAVLSDLRIFSNASEVFHRNSQLRPLFYIIRSSSNFSKKIKVMADFRIYWWLTIHILTNFQIL